MPDSRSRVQENQAWLRSFPPHINIRSTTSASNAAHLVPNRLGVWSLRRGSIQECDGHDESKQGQYFYKTDRKNIEAPEHRDIRPGMVYEPVCTKYAVYEYLNEFYLGNDK